MARAPFCAHPDCDRVIAPGQAVVRVDGRRRPVLPDSARALTGYEHAEHLPADIRQAYALIYEE